MTSELDHKLAGYRDIQTTCSELLALLSGDDPDPALFAQLQDRLAHAASSIEGIVADTADEARQLASAAAEADRLVRCVATSADGRSRELAIRERQQQHDQRLAARYAIGELGVTPQFCDKKG